MIRCVTIAVWRNRKTGRLVLPSEVELELPQSEFDRLSGAGCVRRVVAEKKTSKKKAGKKKVKRNDPIEGNTEKD